MVSAPRTYLLLNLAEPYLSMTWVEADHPMKFKSDSFNIYIIVMKIHLYLDYISQPARTVLAFCKISNIPFQIT